MPFTADEISAAGKIALDYYLRNKPIDQVAVERPWLKLLMSKKRTAPGAKQFIVEQLRIKYQSNFQWFSGGQTVTYNKRNPNEQASYAWRSAHDGFAIDEDRLVQNGIQVDDSVRPNSAADAEKVQLTNLFEELMEVLRLGFEEQFSRATLLDGSASVDGIGGLDSLVTFSPTKGTVGGINRATAGNEYWRNHASTGLTTTTGTGDILKKMEIAYRACVRNGGRPDFMMSGSQFWDGYRDFMLNSYGRMDFGPSNEKVLEGGTKMLTFHSSEVEWMAEFADLDALGAVSPIWEKRFYMLNTKHIKLRPMAGQDMQPRKPPRPYDRYEWYFAITWRGALTMNRSNGHAALSIA
jgi:hypothetical protein